MGICYRSETLMCIIVEINPGVEIPMDQLVRGCEINKHGYGLAYPEGKGKLKVEHSLDTNDAEKIAQRLSELKWKKIFLHLRHATVGAVNRQNAHPFRTLNKTPDGIDLCMMHNGTFHDSMYRPEQGSALSDTYLFNTRFLTPLAKRFIKDTKKKLLKDGLFNMILRKEIGYASVVLLFDGEGNSLWFNGDKGKQYDGYRTSNDHLESKFHHRLSASSSTSNDDWEGCGAPWYGTRRSSETSTRLPGKEWTQTSQGFVPFTRLTDTLKSQKNYDDYIKDLSRREFEITEMEKIVKKAEETDTSVKKVILSNLMDERIPFVEQVGASSLDEVGNLTVDQLEECCENFPKAMAQLVLDLFKERNEKKAAA